MYVHTYWYVSRIKITIKFPLFSYVLFCSLGLRVAKEDKLAERENSEQRPKLIEVRVAIGIE